MGFETHLAAINAAVDADLTTADEQAAVHTPAVGTPQTGIVVVLRDPFEAEGSDRGTHLMASATASQFDQAPALGDRLGLGAASYVIRNIHADQGGRLALTLERYSGV